MLKTDSEKARKELRMRERGKEKGGSEREREEK